MTVNLLKSALPQRCCSLKTMLPPHAASALFHVLQFISVGRIGLSLFALDSGISSLACCWWWTCSEGPCLCPVVWVTVLGIVDPDCSHLLIFCLSPPHHYTSPFFFAPFLPPAQHALLFFPLPSGSSGGGSPSGSHGGGSGGDSSLLFFFLNCIICLC